MAYRIHSASADYRSNEEQRECARGDRCLASESVILPDGTRGRQGALGYQTFCRTDRSFILQCLEQFPGYWHDLRASLGDKAQGNGVKVSGSRTPPIPLNLTVDSLMDELVSVTASWAGRVADVADLQSVNADRPLRAYVEYAFADMCEVLGAHLDTLIGLDEEAMTRFMANDEADALPDGTPVRRNYHTGVAAVLLDLSGADAGLEVVRLNARCRWMLGLTGRDEKITGRCFTCEQVDVLVRPDGAAGLADYAECSACGMRYFGAEYKLLMRQAYEHVLAEQRDQPKAS